ncbi:DNA glycosylase [Hypoxylon trugodes]|uniref:DNA glycosylase n=1 Tax=Hypoxylon trugodes TaxID=326681 RepID=UPI00219A2C5C|nr:DNA glycosylase [Hypoxylon trugodes]KAI1392298.1 DNA glycosylase [Hypoxylon trugodes]
MGKSKRKTRAVPVKGGWDALPHNMGVLKRSTANQALPAVESPFVVDAVPIVEPSAIAGLAPTHDGQGEITKPAQNILAGIQAVHLNVAEDVPAQRTRSKTIIKIKVPNSVRSDRASETNADLQFKVEATQEQSKPTNIEIDIVQNSGRQLRPRKPKLNPTTPILVEAQSIDVLSDKASPTKRKRQTNATFQEDDQTHDDQTPEPSPKKTKKTHKKGLMPGVTPFPEFLAPSAKQCEEVFNLLSEMHGDVQAQAPDVIPAPSLEVTGCGEVPSVLDALMRTLLSGAVTFEGANRMLNSLVAKYGTLDEGVGQGSVNWNNVRLAPLEDVVATIHQGGLANIKAKYIKGILDMVYQENLERREAYLEERKTGRVANVVGAAEKTQGQKDFEIQKTEQNILSLDHLHGLSKDEAMTQFTKYPGIGIKTSACVTLFCLQKPCFAVDTHVHRFSRWLGWAPQKASADNVFHHLEVRCPDRFKYGLHQLFIRHGQTCKKCAANTSEGTSDWAKFSECPLEKLLHRFDKKQSKASPKSKDVKEEQDQEQCLEQNVDQTGLITA